jgi:hypothetical protein
MVPTRQRLARNITPDAQHLPGKFYRNVVQLATLPVGEEHDTDLQTDNVAKQKFRANILCNMSCAKCCLVETKL